MARNKYCVQKKECTQTRLKSVILIIKYCIKAIVENNDCSVCDMCQCMLIICRSWRPITFNSTTVLSNRAQRISATMASLSITFLNRSVTISKESGCLSIGSKGVVPYILIAVGCATICMKNNLVKPLCQLLFTSFPWWLLFLAEINFLCPRLLQCHLNYEMTASYDCWRLD